VICCTFASLQLFTQRSTSLRMIADD